MVTNSSMWYFVMLFCLIIVLVNSISVSSRYNIGFPSDCGDIDIKKGSGVYMIYPEGVEDGFNVYCNMETDNVGGGWTVFQQRLNGEVDFYRGWNDYKYGFGTLDGEHWLGNKNLNILTTQDKYELLITMQDFTNHTGYAKYANFKIENEELKFKMTISSYNGNVGRYNIGIPSDCGDIDIKKESGVYMIYPKGVEDGFNVYCNMETDNVGGGWTVFQQRLNGEVDFYRGWNDYKYGFGTLDEEHWLGNKKLNILTTQDKYELLITMQDFTNHTGYAKYANFKIGNEDSKFKMTISSYTGNVGDSLSNHNGKNFTTKDQDNDEYGGNCASSYKGAWWYGSCHSSNLNGQYLGGKHTSYADGINWKPWKGLYYSLKTTNMMIRKKQ